MPDYQIPLAVAGCLLWGACFLGCLRVETHRRDDGLVPRPLQWPLIMMAAFLIIGATTGFQQGVPVRVLGLGFISYLFPAIGLVVGYRFRRDVDSVRRLLAVFCLLNAVLIGTSLLEIAGIKSPVLGGIMMEWYRVLRTCSIPLPCGIYRSPDILGLHAAHVFAFALLLALTANTAWRRVALFAIMYWGGAILIVSARRKMQGLVVVFICMFAWLRARTSNRAGRASARGLSRRIALAALVLLGAAAIVFGKYAWAIVLYAASIISDAPQRVLSAVFLEPLATLRQSGFWGAGLGSATQGNSIVGNGFISGWQEDGLSRLVLEGGILGAACAIIATVFLLAVMVRHVLGLAAKSQPGNGVGLLLDAGLLSVFVGNLACFCISHQHLSGDPVFGALAGFWAGCIWQGTSVPREK